jgi:hypothetical protein
MQINDTGHIELVSYDEADPVSLTRSVLTEPEKFPRHLLLDHFTGS